MSKLWGGRFNKKTDALVEQFTKSIQYDVKLAEYDCMGSMLHIDVLKKAGLLTAAEHKKLQTGLKKILKKITSGSFKIDTAFEDIHSYIQHLLEKDKAVGAVALKLQTCRSRNDQVVFASKLYCKDNLAITRALIDQVNQALIQLAAKNTHVYMPGYTHLQHAMPIHLASYLIAYGEMFLNDMKRLDTATQAIELTMGSGALAGTCIDSKYYSSTVASRVYSNTILTVDAPVNPLHTVSDRDFVIETLSALAIAGMHLSRLAEDFILWSTKEFDFIDIDDAFCTGSSLMPQKKNPDVLELIRGYAGTLYGNLMSVLVMMKGLPLSYNRDMQLDKEPLFESFEIVQTELTIIKNLLSNITFKKANIDKQLDNEALYATDIADLLVKKGVAFKNAHDIVGTLIADVLKKDISILDLSDSEIKKYHPTLTRTALKNIIKKPEASVTAKTSIRK